MFHNYENVYESIKNINKKKEIQTLFINQKYQQIFDNYIEKNFYKSRPTKEDLQKHKLSLENTIKSIKSKSELDYYVNNIKHLLLKYNNRENKIEAQAIYDDLQLTLANFEITLRVVLANQDQEILSG
jgi:hypothetical protein